LRYNPFNHHGNPMGCKANHTSAQGSMQTAFRLRITVKEITMMNDETKVSHKQEQQQVENEHAHELTESELAKVSGGLKPVDRDDDLEVER
jgi:bacteriocin-like protein